ncbi:uncharacterized protein PG986_012702 [Apiospora aurea]|uniref:Uncharacterized protein n=1 Tax=Apiospora aurea TaxID=335848 RepID=A0ABR1Q0R4_9PEZI
MFSLARRHGLIAVAEDENHNSALLAGHKLKDKTMPGVMHGRVLVKAIDSGRLRGSELDVLS